MNVPPKEEEESPAVTFEVVNARLPSGAGGGRATDLDTLMFKFRSVSAMMDEISLRHWGPLRARGGGIVERRTRPFVCCGGR